MAFDSLRHCCQAGDLREKGGVIRNAAGKRQSYLTPPGFSVNCIFLYGHDQRVEMWKAAAAASGIDYGKDLAEKQILDKLAPRIAERFAAKLGAEAAEKWAGRLIPLASSAIGGALNFSFVRGWGRRVQRHLRRKHLEAKISSPPPGYPEVEAAFN